MNKTFHSIESEKQERIINAAMKEFTGGFKHASTDVISRNAGISKGVIFHHFGTKEKFYDSLIDYAIGIISAEYIERIDTQNADIFDSIWQMALLKQEIAKRHPTIFQFLSSVYIDAKKCPAKKHLIKFEKIRAEKFAEVYESCDKSLFRDGVDPQKAVDLVLWALDGWAETKTRRFVLKNIGRELKENYDAYLVEMKGYLDILRQCFYK